MCACLVPVIALDIFVLGMDVALSFGMDNMGCLDGVTPGMTYSIGYACEAWV